MTQLVAEILQGELLSRDLLRQALGFIGVQPLLGLLDERQDVAHTQNPRSHPLGMEELEILRFLPHPQEANRDIGDAADRQRGPAARIAIQLGEDDTGDLE